MDIPAHGYAAQNATDPLGPFHFSRRHMRPDDVLIDILYCGVCHSDIHHARGDWAGSVYPMVPGHEIVGRVREVGQDVRSFKQGDLVGVGCMVDACGACSSCHNHLEQYCENGATMTYNGRDRLDHSLTYGGYSDCIVVKDRFVLHMPSSLDVTQTAPLLCAGITTYSPLKHWHVGPGTRVGVVGLGGLGHMGIKFAAAMGAHVTLLTRSPQKAEDARRFGAHEILVTTKANAFQEHARSFDFILDTVPYVHDVNPYVGLLDVGGTLVLVGYLGPLDPPVNAASLIMGRKAVAGSVIGGIAQTQEMLDFCGKHNITCDVEMIPIQEINTAYDRMVRADVKYRFVIDMESLKGKP